MKTYTTKEIKEVHDKMDNFINEKHNALDFIVSGRIESGNIFISSYDIKNTDNKIVCKLVINSNHSREISSWIANKNTNPFAKPEKTK